MKYKLDPSPAPTSPRVVWVLCTFHLRFEKVVNIQFEIVVNLQRSQLTRSTSRDCAYDAHVNHGASLGQRFFAFLPFAFFGLSLDRLALASFASLLGFLFLGFRGLSLGCLTLASSVAGSSPNTSGSFSTCSPRRRSSSLSLSIVSSPFCPGPVWLYVESMLLLL